MRGSCSMRRSMTAATASTNLVSTQPPVVAQRVRDGRGRRARWRRRARRRRRSRGRATGRAGCGACPRCRGRPPAARRPRPSSPPAPARGRAATPASSIRPSLIISRRDPLERIARAPGRLLVLGAVAEGAARVRPVLVEEAVDLGLDDRGAVARAHALGGLLHREVHGERVHAVDAPAAGSRSPARAPRTAVSAVISSARGRDRVQVVLDEEADRQLPRRGEVHRLEHRADLAGAVAEVVDGEVGRCPTCFCAQALPVAIGAPPPTIALVPSAPASNHCRCIEPPRPRQ